MIQKPKNIRNQKWSISTECCNQCGRTSFPHRGKGYCSRCYPVLKLKIKLESWNYENWKSIEEKRFRSILNGIKEDENRKGYFEEAKRNVLRQINDRLHFLSRNKWVQKNGCQSYVLFQNFGQIAKKCESTSKNVFLNSNEAHALDAEQRKYVYNILWNIFEGIKWGGINWNDTKDHSSEFFIVKNEYL